MRYFIVFYTATFQSISLKKPKTKSEIGLESAFYPNKKETLSQIAYKLRDGVDTISITNIVEISHDDYKCYFFPK